MTHCPNKVKMGPAPCGTKGLDGVHQWCRTCWEWWASFDGRYGRHWESGAMERPTGAEGNEMKRVNVAVAVSVNDESNQSDLEAAVATLEDGLSRVCTLLGAKHRKEHAKWENRRQGVGAFYDPESGHLRLT